MWIGSDGNLYVGDTVWHSDSRPDPIEYDYTRIKVALYLEEVTKQSGCLRVIPGSHRPPLHEELEPVRHFRQMQKDFAGKTKTAADVAAEMPENPPSATPFGAESSDRPGFAIESQPGDAVFFNQRLWHSSFGGGIGRRMFTLNYGQKPTTEDHFKLGRIVYDGSLSAAKKMQHTPTDGFLRSDRPRIQGMMATAHDLGFK